MCDSSCCSLRIVDEVCHSGMGWAIRKYPWGNMGALWGLLSAILNVVAECRHLNKDFTTKRTKTKKKQLDTRGLRALRVLRGEFLSTFRVAGRLYSAILNVAIECRHLNKVFTTKRTKTTKEQLDTRCLRALRALRVLRGDIFSTFGMFVPPEPPAILNVSQKSETPSAMGRAGKGISNRVLPEELQGEEVISYRLGVGTVAETQTRPYPLFRTNESRPTGTEAPGCSGRNGPINWYPGRPARAFRS